jgi:hypothetical protein
MGRILAALAATTAVSIAAPAGAVTFDFSFTNVYNGGGFVEGTVSNLVDNATSAGDVAVTSNTDGFGIGSYIGLGGYNAFTVANGTMVNAFYASLGVGNSDPATICCSLILSADGTGLTPSPTVISGSNEANLTFTPAPIPLPAPAALLAAGLALLAAVGRRRQIPRASAG